MKSTRITLLSLVLLLVTASVAIAGVRGDDRPVVTRGSAGVWTPAAGELDASSLNPAGDRWGDGEPHFAADPQGGWWATWSLGDRSRDRDVVVAHFDGVTWSPFQWVTGDDGRSDLDPRIAVLSTGEPVVAWWRKGTREDRTPEVLVSVLRAGAWTAPTRVSSPGIAAWQPGVRAEGTDLYVAFQTAEGIVIELVPLAPPPSAFGGTNGPSPFPGRGDADTGGGSEEPGGSGGAPSSGTKRPGS
jgi:hypothetical protein